MMALLHRADGRISTIIPLQKPGCFILTEKGQREQRKQRERGGRGSFLGIQRYF